MGEGLRRAFRLVNLPIAMRKLLAEALADGCTPEDLTVVLAQAYGEVKRGEIEPDKATIRRRERTAERLARKSREGDR